jgi:UDP-GlcNAc:undecaprenyl-phosphate GlcNAc-1-phosphate transferase
VAFAVFPWQIVLAVDVAAALVMAAVTAWPYFSRKTAQPGE